MKPCAAGYLSLPVSGGTRTPEEILAAAHQALADFVAAEGYALGGVFSDLRGRTESGLYALRNLIELGQVVAVVTPSLDHFGHLACLEGADAQVVSRHLRARLLVTGS